MSEIENFDAMFNGSNESTPVTEVKTENVTNEVATATTTSVASPDSFVISIESAGSSLLSDLGIKPISFGDRIQRVPIEKYKAKQGNIDRISIISEQVLPIKYHYIDGKGSYLCTGGKCCQLMGDPAVRYLIPICVYDTTKNGDPASSNIELKVLSMSNELYQNIGMIANAGNVRSLGGITHVDITVNCTDEKYQKLSLIPIGEAMWRKSAKAVEFLNNKWQDSASEAYRALARSVDEATFVKLYDEANFGVKPEENQGFGGSESNFNSFGGASTSNFDEFFK